MSRTAAQKYAFFERLAPTACITLALVLPISAALHMPDISFIMSSVGAGLLFFLGWQATLRHMHAAVPAAFFLSGTFLAFMKVAQPIIQMPAPLFYLQGLGTPAFSFFLMIWVRTWRLRSDNAK